MLVSQRQCSASEEVIGREEDDRFRTIECLRGRLQAERVASKAAKEEAENLAQRLDDLEKKLAEETKRRGRAEKKLQYALKKLETLKILDDKCRLEVPESSASSSSSQFLSDHQRSVGNDSYSTVKDSCKCDSVELIKDKQISMGSEDGLTDEASCSSVNLLHDQLVQQEEGSCSLVGHAQSNPDDESRSNDNNEHGNNQELAIVVLRLFPGRWEHIQRQNNQENHAWNPLLMTKSKKNEQLMRMKM